MNANNKYGVKLDNNIRPARWGVSADSQKGGSGDLNSSASWLGLEHFLGLHPQTENDDCKTTTIVGN